MVACENYSPRILFTNNYSAAAKQAEWQAGRTGREHCWGVPELRDMGFQVDVLPFRDHYVMSSPRWGNLPQQRAILKRYRRFDVLYVGAQPLINALGLLRALGLFRKPIVAICHHGLPGGRIPSLYVRGIDHLIFLSRRMAEIAVDQYPALKDRVSVLDWGFDLDYHRPSDEQGPFLIAAGKTLRDYDTLCKALDRVPVPTQIFCSSDSAPRVPVPACVTVVAGEYSQNAISDEAMQSWYARAFAVAIPLQDQPVLLGLTSLLDAMAHAKPVIITKTPFLDIDVEAEGCGFSVAPGDSDAWASAIEQLKTQPEKARQMGLRGRELCVQRYNSTAFAQSLATLLRGIQ